MFSNNANDQIQNTIDVIGISQALITPTNALVDLAYSVGIMKSFCLGQSKKAAIANALHYLCMSECYAVLNVLCLCGGG